jgi:hypothetical protein
MEYNTTDVFVIPIRMDPTVRINNYLFGFSRIRSGINTNAGNKPIQQMAFGDTREITGSQQADNDIAQLDEQPRVLSKRVD